MIQVDTELYFERKQLHIKYCFWLFPIVLSYHIHSCFSTRNARIRSFKQNMAVQKILGIKYCMFQTFETFRESLMKGIQKEKVKIPSGWGEMTDLALNKCTAASVLVALSDLGDTVLLLLLLSVNRLQNHFLL